MCGVTESPWRIVMYSGTEMTQGLFGIFQEAVDEVCDEIEVATEFLEFA